MAEDVCGGIDWAKDTHDVFNIWPGFQAHTAAGLRRGESPARAVHLWARGDEKVYLDILAWFRFMLAHPDVKLGVAMLIMLTKVAT